MGEAENAAGDEQARPASRLFYGWIVVAAAFTVMFLAFGIAYTFGSFFQALQKTFAANRGDISLIFSLSGFLYFGLGAISGPLADRIGPRPVILFGMACIAIGLLLASRASSLMQVYLAYGLGVGVGVGFAYVPAIAAVQRWFVRRRGFMSGLAVAGIGAGTIAMPPLAAWLIDIADWRFAYIVLAITAAAIGGIAALLIHASPHARGLAPDGDKPAEAGYAAATPSGYSVGAALRSRFFWQLYVACLACSFGVFIPFVHLVSFAQDQGHSEAVGVMLVGLLGVGSLAGRFLLGGFADRIGRQATLAGLFAGMGLSLLFWLAASGVWSLSVFAVIFGAMYGGFVALMPALTTDLFGGRHVAGIIGMLYSSVAVGTLLGPTLAGFAFDIAGSYTLPILASVAANGIAVMCVIRLPRSRLPAIMAMPE